MFEWDEAKRQTNLAKHKLDFVDAVLMFDGRASVTAPSNYPVEARFVTTAMIHGKFYSLVWTWRDQSRRIISFRRARDGEERSYREAHGR
ncbi:MAG: BrnT family toxin [Methylocystis sp.]